MTILYGMGELPEAIFGLAFGFACALLIGFGCLKILVGLVTREQYNVTDASRRVRIIFWTPRGGRAEGATSGTNRHATGLPDLLSASAPDHLLARPGESVGAAAERMVEFS